MTTLEAINTLQAISFLIEKDGIRKAIIDIKDLIINISNANETLQASYNRMANRLAVYKKHCKVLSDNNEYYMRLNFGDTFEKITKEEYEELRK